MFSRCSANCRCLTFPVFKCLVRNYNDGGSAAEVEAAAAAAAVAGTALFARVSNFEIHFGSALAECRRTGAHCNLVAPLAEDESGQSARKSPYQHARTFANSPFTR
jgi:hypothetical protein